MIDKEQEDKEFRKKVIKIVIPLFLIPIAAAIVALIIKTNKTIFMNYLTTFFNIVFNRNVDITILTAVIISTIACSNLVNRKK